jgi:hypothetical protein
MADLATNVPQMLTSQASKEVTFNALIDAGSQATLFGRNYLTTTSLTWGFLGGMMTIDGVLTRIANGTVTLTNGQTNYVEATRAGSVSVNTTAFTAGRIPLYQITVAGNVVTNYLDLRVQPIPTGRLQLAMADANTTLTAAQARNRILRFTGTLAAQRNIVLPLAEQEWIVQNNTTGGFGLQFIGATGTGVVVAAARHAIIYSDGTNIVRVTADQA